MYAEIERTRQAENTLVEKPGNLQMDGIAENAATGIAIISNHNGLQYDVRSGDSISNVQSRLSVKSVTSWKSSGSGKRSSISGTFSARIRAEADPAALMAWQRLLQDKHALEEEEQQIWKSKERLLLDEEIATCG